MSKLKSDIRRRCRTSRLRMTDLARREADAAISRRLLDLVANLQPSVVSVFWPIERNCEIDTRPFILNLAKVGIEVALPCISKTEPGVMYLRQFESESDLTKDNNRWGILEPQSGPRIEPADIGLVVAPALAADRTGSRLGYGVGYYDRFLQKVVCPTASIVYSVCLLDRIPAEEHDVRVNYVVTEFDTIVTANPAT